MEDGEGGSKSNTQPFSDYQHGAGSTGKWIPLKSRFNT